MSSIGRDDCRNSRAGPGWHGTSPRRRRFPVRPVAIADGRDAIASSACQRCPTWRRGDAAQPDTRASTMLKAWCFPRVARRRSAAPGRSPFAGHAGSVPRRGRVSVASLPRPRHGGVFLILRRSGRHPAGPALASASGGQRAGREAARTACPRHEGSDGSLRVTGAHAEAAVGTSGSWRTHSSAMGLSRIGKVRISMRRNSRFSRRVRWRTQCLSLSTAAR